MDRSIENECNEPKLVNAALNPGITSKRTTFLSVSLDITMADLIQLMFLGEMYRTLSDSEGWLATERGPDWVKSEGGLFPPTIELPSLIEAPLGCASATIRRGCPPWLAAGGGSVTLISWFCCWLLPLAIAAWVGSLGWKPDSWGICDEYYCWILGGEGGSAGGCDCGASIAEFCEEVLLFEPRMRGRCLYQGLADQKGIYKCGHLPLSWTHWALLGIGQHIGSLYLGSSTRFSTCDPANLMFEVGRKNSRGLTSRLGYRKRVSCETGTRDVTKQR